MYYIYIYTHTYTYILYFQKIVHINVGITARKQPKRRGAELEDAADRGRGSRAGAACASGPELQVAGQRNANEQENTEVGFNGMID